MRNKGVSCVPGGIALKLLISSGVPKDASVKKPSRLSIAFSLLVSLNLPSKVCISVSGELFTNYTIFLLFLTSFAVIGKTYGSRITISSITSLSSSR